MSAPLAIAIVGAGIHGTLIAARLLHERPSVWAGLRLVDPSGSCLAEWRRQTTGQGMDQMRSPAAHHLDVAPESLLRFARRHERECELKPPYQRPSLGLFGDHCRSLVGSFRLEDRIVPERALAITRTAEGYRLELSKGAIDCRALVLAPGLRGQERIPDWAAPLVASEPSRVRHAADVEVGSEPLQGRRVLVVGGGLTAATLADAAACRGARVTLVSRHPLQCRLFDTDPGWVGPKYLRPFHAEASPEARLRMIDRARGRASVTPELLDRLSACRRAGRIEILSDNEVVAVRREPGGLGVRLLGPSDLRPFDRIWLATGFAPSIERLGWLAGLGPLPCHRGRPVLSPSLEVKPRCFASGWMAEIEVGPIARNISGARHAAERIAASLRS